MTCRLLLALVFGSSLTGLVKAEAWAAEYPVPIQAIPMPGLPDTVQLSLTRAHGKTLRLDWFTQGQGVATQSGCLIYQPDQKQWSGVEPQPDIRQIGARHLAVARPLANGRVLAVFIESKARGKPSQAQLRSRLMGSSEPDQVVDDAVVADCAPDLTAFPNGNALLIYRAHRPDGGSVIRTAIYRHGQWGKATQIGPSSWNKGQLPAPGYGPRVDSHGGTVAAVWLSTGSAAPHLLASRSPDAGARWLMPQQIDLGHPIGPADTLMLQDGSQLLAWWENKTQDAAATLYLRRISSSGDLGVPVPLARSSGSPLPSPPLLAVLKDYDATPAQILVIYTDTTPNTLLVTLPSLSKLAKRAPCLPCDEANAAAHRGYAMKGLVRAVLPREGIVLVQQEEIPGVMEPTMLPLHVDRALLGQLSRGRALLGRIERRQDEWWLFHVRLLGQPIP